MAEYIVSKPVLYDKKPNKAAKKSKGFFGKLMDQRNLCLAILPALLVVIIFQYLPLYGIVAAFQNFDITKGYFGSSFVGFKNFQIIFSDPDFGRIFAYTLRISITKYILGLAIPVIFALLLNELSNVFFKRVVQSISYLPYFLSWVIVTGMTYRFLDTEGSLNSLLVQVFHTEQVQFLTQPSYFFPIVIVSELWKNTGYAAIIYLAALSAIDPTQYEAGKIDGAGRLRLTWHITLPGIMPTIITIAILSAGGLAGAGFDQVFNLQNSIIRSDTHVLETFIYMMGVERANYSFGIAAGLFQGGLAALLLLTTNFFSQKATGTGIFKIDS